MPQSLLKIFISSPSDVNAERRRTSLVITRLQREFARFFEIHPVLWELNPQLGGAHFQDIIDPPSKADIVVLILWRRLGTPLPERTEKAEYRGIDGRHPVTGTEWEYEDALAARQRRHGVPDLLVYRRMAKAEAQWDRVEELDQAKQQWEALQGFWHRHFEDSEGHFKAAFNRFVTLDEFDALIEKDLRERLRVRLPPGPLRFQRTQDAAQEVSWWDGSPYRGLQVFDSKHATIFFGRERAEREIIEALVRRADEGAAFMLVLGASGSGKSSLVRAGILPDLVTPGIVAGATAWRHAIVVPDELIQDPYEGFAQAFAEAVPELREVGFSPKDVAAQLKGGPELAAMPLRLALERAAAAEGDAFRQGSANGRLVLVLDQMEVLFTAPGFDDAARRAIDALVAGLARSGLVWVIATMRSDFFHRMVELPALKELAAQGQFLLAPPTTVEIEQIITRPAEAAGVAFEIDAGASEATEETPGNRRKEREPGTSLAQEIRDDAASDPAALPLLSFVLDELYRRDIEFVGVEPQQDGAFAPRTVLTFLTYDELGGLEGAIANHAERLVHDLAAEMALAAAVEVTPGELPPELAKALRAVLLALVEVDELKGMATARTVREASFAGPLQKRLGERLVQARLVVADDPGTGRTLRIAHEALLSRWPRLERLIDDHRDFLVSRRRLQSETANWDGHARDPELLLLSSRRLAEAEEILKDHRDALDPEMIAYIDASLAAEQARRAEEERRKEDERLKELRTAQRIARIFRNATVTAVALFVMAAILAAFAWYERGRAGIALDEAASNYRAAVDQAAGASQLLANSYEDGSISTVLMKPLMAQALATVNRLRGDTDDVTSARIRLLDDLALAYVTFGDIVTARKFAVEENALADRLIAKDASSLQWRQLWAVARGQLSDAQFYQGDLAGALERGREAVNAALEVVAANPDDEVMQRSLFFDYERVADALRAQGDLDGATGEYRRWLDHANDLHARHPKDPQWLRALAFGYERLGDVLLAQGKAADASVQYRSFNSFATQAVAAEPQNAIFQDALTLSHQRLGDSQLAQGNFTEALVEYKTYEAMAARLLNRIDPSNFRWHQFLEIAHQRIGEVLMAEKDFDGALKEYQTYASMAQDALEKDPGQGRALYDAANAGEKVGDALRELGRLDDAARQYRKELTTMTRLAREDPSNAEWQKSLAMAHQRVGLTLLMQQNIPGAADEFSQCTSVSVKRAVYNPRTIWPPDVTAYCRAEVERLGGARPK